MILWLTGLSALTLLKYAFDLKKECTPWIEYPRRCGTIHHGSSTVMNLRRIFWRICYCHLHTLHFLMRSYTYNSKENFFNNIEYPYLPTGVVVLRHWTLIANPVEGSGYVTVAYIWQRSLPFLYIADLEEYKTNGWISCEYGIWQLAALDADCDLVRKLMLLSVIYKSVLHHFTLLYHKNQICE